MESENSNWNWSLEIERKRLFWTTIPIRILDYSHFDSHFRFGMPIRIQLARCENGLSLWSKTIFRSVEFAQFDEHHGAPVARLHCGVHYPLDSISNGYIQSNSIYRVTPRVTSYQKPGLLEIVPENFSGMLRAFVRLVMWLVEITEITEITQLAESIGTRV